MDTAGPQTPAPAEAIAEGWVELQAADGHRLKAWAAPPAASPKGRVVVLQELFGVNAHMRSVTAACARAGYAALAPALFDRVERDVSLGYDKAALDHGLALRNALPPDRVLLDVDAALHLDGAPGTAIVLGFCWGGTLAWLAASRLPVRAAGAYYGGQIGDPLDQRPRAPVLAHFGRHDHSIPLAVPDALMRDHPTVLTHLYAAGHGFNGGERSSHDPASAELAWRRTLSFLDAVS